MLAANNLCGKTLAKFRKRRSILSMPHAAMTKGCLILSARSGIDIKLVGNPTNGCSMPALSS